MPKDREPPEEGPLVGAGVAPTRVKVQARRAPGVPFAIGAIRVGPAMAGPLLREPVLAWLTASSPPQAFLVAETAVAKAVQATVEGHMAEGSQARASADALQEDLFKGPSPPQGSPRRCHTGGATPQQHFSSRAIFLRGQYARAIFLSAAPFWRPRPGIGHTKDCGVGRFETAEERNWR